MIPLYERHAAGTRMDDPIDHPSHREATLEAEGVADEVQAGVLFKVEGTEGSAVAGLKAAQRGSDPPEFRLAKGCLRPVTTGAFTRDSSDCSSIT